MANAVKMFNDTFFFFFSRNSEHIMLYEKAKNYCVPKWLKENECSSHVMIRCKNEKLKTSLRTDEDRIIYFTTSVYDDYSASCLDYNWVIRK